MFNENDWRELATRLLRLTRGHNLQWQLKQTASVRPTYTTLIGRTEYRLWARDHDDRFPYVIGVFRDVGSWELDNVAEFETDSFIDEDGSASDIVSRLYVAASRDATGADRTLSELMREIDQIDPDLPF